jgi:hypothetical protein
LSSFIDDLRSLENLFVLRVANSAQSVCSLSDPQGVVRQSTLWNTAVVNWRLGLAHFNVVGRQSVLWTDSLVSRPLGPASNIVRRRSLQLHLTLHRFSVIHQASRRKFIRWNHSIELGPTDVALDFVNWCWHSRSISSLIDSSLFLLDIYSTIRYQDECLCSRRHSPTVCCRRFKAVVVWCGNKKTQCSASQLLKCYFHRIAQAHHSQIFAVVRQLQAAAPARWCR